MAPRTYDLEGRLISHACAVCRVAESLPLTVVGRHVAGQLIRAGTSPAANYGEAQGAESRRDFGHKLRLCLKEMRESRVWMRMIEKLGLAAEMDVKPVLEEEDELIAILVTSIRTAYSPLRNGRGNVKSIVQSNR